MARKRDFGGLLLLGSLILGPFFIEFYIDNYILWDHDEDVNAIIIVMPYVIMIIIGSIMTFIGAVMAFIGWKWRRTMFFASFSFLTLGPFFAASMLGVLALVIISFARAEFGYEKSLIDIEKGNPTPPHRD